MNEKYEFTGETKTVSDNFLMGLKERESIYTLYRTLLQIRAKKDFGDVKKGDIGGWIEKEENLDSEGTCWVYDQAIVCEDAIVRGDAKVQGRARVSDSAFIYGRAVVKDDSLVFGNAKINNRAVVRENAKVYGWSNVEGEVYGSATISDHADIFPSSKVFGNACVTGRAKAKIGARISGNAKVYDCAVIDLDAEVSGDVMIGGDVYLGAGAKVSHQNDFLHIGNFLKNFDGRTSITIYRLDNNSLVFNVLYARYRFLKRFEFEKCGISEEIKNMVIHLADAYIPKRKND